MIVIENPNGRMNAGERAFVAHQRGKQGIALVNFNIGGGGPRKPGREIDAIMILPRGIFAVEVKATTAKGDLDSPANDTWSVGDVVHPFSSRSKSPAAQADQATKILAGHLAGGKWPKDYITPVVSIHGPVTIAEKVRWVGTVGVSTVEHFDLVVRAAKGKRIQAHYLPAMLARLGVSKNNIPTLERLLEEGFGDGTEPKEEAAPPAKAKPKNTQPAAAPARQEPAEEPDTANPEPEPRTSRLLRRVDSRRGLLTAAALIPIAVLLGLWQLMSGDLVRLLFTPQPGEHLFLYGTWTSHLADTETMALSPVHALDGFLLGLALMALCSTGLWLRSKIGSVTRLEISAYLVSVFLAVAVAPVLFHSTGWLGVAWASLAYTFFWPLLIMVGRDLLGPLKRYVAHLRDTYTM